MKLRNISDLLGEQWGVNPLRLAQGLVALPSYLFQYFQFRSMPGGGDQPLVLRPCLHDAQAEGGATQSEYFWQDLYVARQIAQAKPGRHVDVGSRVDGFVAHVASYRAIEVMDIRPITAEVPGVIFRQVDLMQLPAHFQQCCDSLSCLHALEHFGLGRYGDPVQPLGHQDGLRNLARMLQPGGTLYLSSPVGLPRVLFNSHRVFDPVNIVAMARDCGLVLHALAWHVPGQQGVHEAQTTSQDADGQPPNFAQDLSHLQRTPYALGLFRFVQEGV